MRRVKRRLSAETPRVRHRYSNVPRLVAVVVAATLVYALIAPGRAQASTQDLVRQLDGLVSAFNGGTGVWISDPTIPTPLFTHDPEEHVITASLYKLGVL